jgi:O-antigen ligase
MSGMAQSTPATAVTGLARRRWATDSRLRPVLFVVSLLVFDVVIGTGVASNHYKYVLLLVVGVAACWLLWRFPLAGLIAGLFFACGIIYPEYFVFRFAGRTVYAYEVVLLVLLVRAAVHPRRHTWGGVAGGALAVFLVLLTLSTLLAVQSGGTSLNNAINWGRPFAALAGFWVIIRLFPDRRSLGILLTAAIVLGAVSGVVGGVLALSGNLNSVFQDSGHHVLVRSSIGSLLRVRMPGLGLGFMLLWLLLVWISRDRRPRALWWVCLPCILLDILVSQNRNMWVSGTFAFALVMMVAGPRVRGRLIVSLVLMTAAIAVTIAIPQGGSTQSTPLQPIVTRASTILSPSTVRTSSSASDRDYEDRYGWADAKDHLLFGIGPGVPYGAALSKATLQDPYATTPRLFLQNQYLYILLITGIPGMVAFAVFLVSTLRNALAAGAPIESLVLGIGVLALMLTAIVMLSFTDPSYLAALGLVAGIIYALRPDPGSRSAAAAPA